MSVRQGNNFIAGLQDISGKANVALDNLTNAGKEVIAHQAMPSSRFVNLTLGATGATYTAPADGYFWLACNMKSGSGNIGIVDSDTISSWVQTTQASYLDVFLPCRKGKVVYVYYSNVNNTRYFRFIYAQGAQ